ncbi:MULTISPECIES: alpha/beta hydrolase [Amycolatopsis]|uniref:Alpha/beta hydrolase n=1 Tax=Amycolatopsis bullii TaxID=941987 RepID=A0ABQ3KPR6_9PSEU|nr:alpha/beta hydrolase [Amycolatopsis bullii]GHG32218.1 alpha/beta hydrolase [Amycolatopsis bullii]
MWGTVLASALLVTGGTPAVAEADWQPAPIVWTACPVDPDSPTPPDGECGTVRVPLDWRSPGGPSIPLAVGRHRATDSAHRLGVLLADFGGPGSSSAELPLTSPFFSPEVRARFDIVGFDVRGTGRSELIECPDAGRPPGDEPAGPAEFAALRAYREQAVAGCRAGNLPVDHANTEVNARDMDAVRRALGEARISFLGISYGTLLGQQYAELFGDRVRAMVLDSVIDHSAGVERFLGDRAAAADGAFRQFAAWCDRTATCTLHGQDVFAVWRKALAATEAIPQAQSELRDRVLKDMYRPDGADIGQTIADAAAGNPPVTAQFTYNYESIRLAVVCQDFDLRIRSFAHYAALHAEELRRGPILRGSTLSHGEAMACLGVHGPPANPPHRLAIPRAPRILLLNSRFDPATPYSWALAVHRQAPANTTLLTYEGSGHGVYEKNACTRSAGDHYLLTPAAPPHDISCPA